MNTYYCPHAEQCPFYVNWKFEMENIDKKVISREDIIKSVSNNNLVEYECVALSSIQKLSKENLSLFCKNKISSNIEDIVCSHIKSLNNQEWIIYKLLNK